MAVLSVIIVFALVCVGAIFYVAATGQEEPADVNADGTVRKSSKQNRDRAA